MKTLNFTRKRNFVGYAAFSLILLTLASCRARFVTPAYQDRFTEHKKVAILPFSAVYTGRIPEEVTEEQIHEIEVQEGFYFQDMFANRLAFETGIRRNDVRLTVMTNSQTNDRLERAGLTPKQASLLSPDSLKSILDVDIIVRGTVKMDRFLSDVESMGVEAVQRVVQIISREVTGGGVPVPGRALSRTYFIQSIVEVVDLDDGAILWQHRNAQNADWNYRPELVIQNMSNIFVNQFPYRNKEFRRAERRNR